MLPPSRVQTFSLPDLHTEFAALLQQLCIYSSPAPAPLRTGKRTAGSLHRVPSPHCSHFQRMNQAVRMFAVSCLGGCGELTRSVARKLPARHGSRDGTLEGRRLPPCAFRPSHWGGHCVSNPEFHSSQRDAPLGPVSATRPEQTQIGANAVLRPGLRVKRENSEGRRLPRRDSTTRNHVGVQLHPTSGRGPALGSGAREHSGSTAVSKLGSVFDANSASKLSVVN